MIVNLGGELDLVSGQLSRMCLYDRNNRENELNFENPYESLRAYISWFGMSTNTKKGRFNLSHPPMCVASKMPLLIFRPEKCTNIPEDTAQGNAMFQNCKSVWCFF